MEQEAVLPCAQQPASCPSSEQDQSGRRPSNRFLGSSLISCHLHRSLPGGLCLSRFPTITHKSNILKYLCTLFDLSFKVIF